MYKDDVSNNMEKYTPNQLNNLLKQNRLWMKGCQFLSSEQKLALLGGDQSVYDIVRKKMNTVRTQSILNPTCELSKHYEKIATELIDKYLPNKGWKFIWKNMTSMYGQCHYSSKIISLSYNLTIIGNRAEKMVVNTLLHEIAHAIVGSGHGHDSVWRQKALEIGSDGNRCHSDVLLEKKYVAICPACKSLHYKNRLSVRNTSCGRCSSKYDERFKLIFSLNPNYKKINYQ